MNIMVVLKYAKYIPIIWDAAQEIVKVVEQAMPEGGQGAAKFQAAKAFLRRVIDVSDEIEAAFDEVEPLVDGIIDAVVALFNATGVFKK